MFENGFFKVPRGLFDSELFKDDAPFSKSTAFIWLLENAVWRETEVQIAKRKSVKLTPGQIHVSTADLGEIWGWERTKVFRFIKKLERNGVVKSRVQQAVQQAVQQNGMILTIENYEKFISSFGDDATSCATSCATRFDDTLYEEYLNNINNNKINNIYIHRAREETDNPAKPSNPDRYAWEGKVIKLNRRDYEKWKQIYRGIPDIDAELYSRDIWLSEQEDPIRKKWFQSTSALLSKRSNQYITQAKKEERAGCALLGPC